MKKYIYDKNLMIEAVSVDSLLVNLGYKLKRKGKITFVKCHYHADNNFGNAYISIFFKNGIVNKGIYCHSCGKFSSVIDLIMYELNLTYPEALQYLFEFLESDQRFIVEEYNSNDNSTCAAKRKVSARALPKAPLSESERMCLGLLSRQNTEPEFSPSKKVIGVYSEKEISLFLNKIKNNDFLEKKYYFTSDTVKNISENKEPVYVLHKEYIKYEPVPYLETMSLDILYNEDPEAFFCMIITKCIDKIATVDSLLSKIKYVTSDELVSLKYALLGMREEISDILIKMKTLQMMSAMEEEKEKVC